MLAVSDSPRLTEAGIVRALGRLYCLEELRIIGILVSGGLGKTGTLGSLTNLQMFRSVS